MTFGIDIGSTQEGIDLVDAKADGVEFVIVKMGGRNVLPQYVAPHYPAQIDEAIRAGLPKGHYWLIGDGDEATEARVQAEYMAKHLYRFDVEHDILALDNEPLNSNADYWHDAKAATFFRRLHELVGIPYTQMWLYGGAYKFRENAPWHEVESLGVRIWWSSYGVQPFTTGQRPTHEPSLQGSVSHWDVHQFTNRTRVAGMYVDGDYSRLSVKELFGREVGSSVPATSKPTPKPVPAKPKPKLHTTAERDGERTDPGQSKSNYWLMVQVIGHREGVYPSWCKEDGEPGEYTRKTEAILTARILNALKLRDRNGHGQIVQTTTAIDGDPYNAGGKDAYSNFIWLIQQNGKNRGTYHGDVDGKWGPLTDDEWVRLLAGWMNRHI